MFTMDGLPRKVYSGMLLRGKNVYSYDNLLDCNLFTFMLTGIVSNWFKLVQTGFAVFIGYLIDYLRNRCDKDMNN